MQVLDTASNVSRIILETRLGETRLATDDETDPLLVQNLHLIVIGAFSQIGLEGKPMTTYLLVGILVLIVWVFLFGAVTLIQRSREDVEYMHQVQRRIDQIADTP